MAACPYKQFQELFTSNTEGKAFLIVLFEYTCYAWDQDQARGTAEERPVAASSNLRAVVLGGGMAGLAAARALSSDFDEVIILERDTLQNCEVKTSPCSMSLMKL
jgi:hypothetical protein